MDSSTEPLESGDLLPDPLTVVAPTSRPMIPVEALVSSCPAKTCSCSDSSKEIFEMLARLEIKLDSLLAKPPIVAHIDPLDVAEYVLELINNGHSFSEIREEMEKGSLFGSP